MRAGAGGVEGEGRGQRFFSLSFHNVRRVSRVKLWMVRGRSFQEEVGVVVGSPVRREAGMRLQGESWHLDRVRSCYLLLLFD